LRRHFSRVDCAGGANQRLAFERLHDALQLTEDESEPDQDQATGDRDRAGDNERVAQAERIDRNTKSDRHQAGGSGQQADSQQNESHRVSVPYKYAGNSHISYQNVAACRIIRKNWPRYSLSKSTID
jgi:hypothetical protein